MLGSPGRQVTPLDVLHFAFEDMGGARFYMHSYKLGLETFYCDGNKSETLQPSLLCEQFYSYNLQLIQA